VEHFLRQAPIFRFSALQSVILQISDGIARVHGLSGIKELKLFAMVGALVLTTTKNHHR
jgi:F0F1-type ATP synthase alpha subunit